MESLADFAALLSSRIDAPIFVLILTRLLPIVALTPLFGGAATPRRFRFVASLALAVVVYPVVAPRWQELGPPVSLASAVVREALLGLSIAVVVAASFDLFASLGGLIDLARGATFANVLDPLTLGQSSVLEPFLRVLLLATFTLSGLHRRFIAAVCEGFLALPPSSSLGFRGEPLVVLGTLQQLVELSIQLALPFLIGMLLLDVSLALANRAAGRIEVYFLGLTLKSTLGLALLLLLLSASLKAWLERGMAPIFVFAGGE